MNAPEALDGAEAAEAEEMVMRDTLKVRDHSRPCEHGSLWPHWLNAAKARWWQEPDCLGGREMTLRRREDGLFVEVEVDGEEPG